MITAGGHVWTGDETTLCEFPPLGACWSRKGDQRLIEITGRNHRASSMPLSMSTAYNWFACCANVTDRRMPSPSFKRLAKWLLQVQNCSFGITRLLILPSESCKPRRREGLKSPFCPLAHQNSTRVRISGGVSKGEIVANRTYSSMEELGERALA